MSYVLGYTAIVFSVILAARYWLVSLNLREENADLVKVNELLRSENQRNAEKANAYEHSNSLLARQIANLKPARTKNGRFKTKKK